jgi:hypothetical protein
MNERDVPHSLAPAASGAREQLTMGKDVPSAVLMLAGAVSHWPVIACLAGTPAWDWSSGSELAALQAARLSG